MDSVNTPSTSVVLNSETPKVTMVLCGQFATLQVIEELGNGIKYQFDGREFIVVVNHNTQFHWLYLNGQSHKLCVEYGISGKHHSIKVTCYSFNVEMKTDDNFVLTNPYSLMSAEDFRDLQEFERSIGG